VELSSNLGSQLGLQLPGTLAFDYPSVMSMATHLHKLLAPKTSDVSSFARATVPAAGMGLPQQGLQANVVQVRRQVWRGTTLRMDLALTCMSSKRFTLPAVFVQPTDEVTLCSRQVQFASRTPIPYQQRAFATGGPDAIRTVSYSRWDLDAVQHQVSILRRNIAVGHTWQAATLDDAR